jgi:general stress protein 26
MAASVQPETKNLSGAEATEKVRELLKHFRSTMMMTQEEHGGFHARPMGLQGKASEFDGRLWFFTDDRSHKMEEIRDDHDVWLIFQSDGDSAYMELKGTARETRDQAKMEKLFKPLIRTWFPEGLDEPHITLIEVDVHEGRFWDSPGGMFQLLGAFAKSVLTGKPGKGGEFGELSL